MFLKKLLKLSNSKYHFKIALLLINTLVFSILYSLLDTSHFTGVNPIQDKIKEEIIEDEVDEVSEVVKDTFTNIVSYKELFGEKGDKDKVEVAQDVKDVVEDDEKKLERPTFFQNFFDAFYFSTITACLLGSGDIYPATNTVKFLVCCQTLSTLSLILY